MVFDLIFACIFDLIFALVFDLYNLRMQYCMVFFDHDLILYMLFKVGHTSLSDTGKYLVGYMYIFVNCDFYWIKSSLHKYQYEVQY